MKKIVFLCVTLLLTACVIKQWEPTGGRYVMNSQGFAVDLPAGWKRYNQTQEALLLTRDGITLQQISISRRAIDKELPHTKKKFAKDMLPQEAAGFIIDDILSNPDFSNVELIDNSPVQVSGYPGFKIVYSYRTKQGLTRKVINYGLLHGDWYYELVCAAPARYYFERDSATFERIEQSFKIL
jgi:hypothetical protein